MNVAVGPTGPAGGAGLTGAARFGGATDLGGGAWVLGDGVVGFCVRGGVLPRVFVLLILGFGRTAALRIGAVRILGLGRRGQVVGDGPGTLAEGLAADRFDEP